MLATIKGEQMDTSTLNQLIQTSGLIFIPIISLSLAYIYANKLIKHKSDLDREIKLSEDLLFYHAVIEKYETLAKHHEDATLRRTYREEVFNEIGYTPSHYSQPSKLKKRLSEMGKTDKKFERAINKVHKNL